jgi:hypothetical protein
MFPASVPTRRHSTERVHIHPIHAAIVHVVFEFPKRSLGSMRARSHVRLMLFVSQRDHGMDLRGAACGNIAGEERNRGQC